MKQSRLIHGLVFLSTGLVLLIGLAGAELFYRQRIWVLCQGNSELQAQMHSLWSEETGYFIREAEQKKPGIGNLKPGGSGYSVGQSTPLFHPLGFKNTEQVPFTLLRSGTKPQCRILILGGSAVAGSEFAVGGDWPSFMGRLIANYDNDLSIRIINGGIWGGLMANETVQLWNFRYYDLDQVYWFTGYNDLYYYFMDHEHFDAMTMPSRQRLSLLHRRSDQLAHFSLLFAKVRHGFQNPHSVHKTLSATPKSAFEKNADPIKYALNAKNEQDFLKHVRRQIRTGLRIARSYGLPVTVVLQPSLTDIERIRPLIEIERQHRDDMVKGELQYWQAVVHEVQPLMIDVIRAECEQAGVPFIYGRDLTLGFKDLFVDDVHLADTGMQVVALALAKDVQKNTLKRSTKAWISYGQ